MAATRVQTKTGDGGGYADPHTIVFASNVTAGNLIVLGFAWDNGVTLDSITDGLGNTYNLIETGIGPSTVGAFYYAYNISGGACTITLDFSSTVDLSYVAREYSGLTTTDPLDKKEENLESSYVTSHPTGTTATTTQANELVVAYYSGDDSLADGEFAISGFSNLVDTPADGLYNITAFADKDVTSTGTQAGTFTSGTVYMQGHGAIATFKEAAAPSVATTILSNLSLMGV